MAAVNVRVGVGVLIRDPKSPGKVRTHGQLLSNNELHIVHYHSSTIHNTNHRYLPVYEKTPTDTVHSPSPVDISNYTNHGSNVPFEKRSKRLDLPYTMYNLDMMLPMTRCKIKESIM